jgi:2-dehydro-3-deoxygluconokinase
MTQGAVICFGEVLLRLTAPDHELLLQSPRLNVCTGGAEANVAVALASFGDAARLVSVLPDNALGRAALAEVRKHGVDVGSVRFCPGRMGLYFLTPGAVLRPSEILYDRAHSAFALAPADLLDWAEPLDGARWLHVSGITPAISDLAAQTALRAVEEARSRGIRVSFDGNHRAKLWAERERDPGPVLRELMSAADLAFVTDQDIGLVLEERFEGGPDERKRAAAEAAFKAFPTLERIACTGRNAHSVSEHELAGFMFTRSSVHRAGPYSLSGIVDRIGAGDAFAAGVLHGLLNGWQDQRTLDFALAAACLKHSIPGDFTPVSEQQVWDALAGGADVRR